MFSKLALSAFFGLGGAALLWKFVTKDNAHSIGKWLMKRALGFAWFRALIKAHGEEINAILEGLVEGAEEAEKED